MAISVVAGAGRGLPRGTPRGGDLLALRDGRVAAVGFVEPRDRAGLKAYFRSLSLQSRYNRFTGARGEFSDQEFDALLRTGEEGRFAVVARLGVGVSGAIVGEARYAFDLAARSLEFGLSVHEAFRGQGIGLAMLSNLECRARRLGADSMFGDTLWTNDEMQGLARKAGFALSNTSGDWREIRLRKAVAARPCADLARAAGRLMIA